jgi:hypothetical protein
VRRRRRDVYTRAQWASIERALQPVRPGALTEDKQNFRAELYRRGGAGARDGPRADEIRSRAEAQERLSRKLARLAVTCGGTQRRARRLDELAAATDNYGPRKAYSDGSLSNAWVFYPCVTLIPRVFPIQAELLVNAVQNNVKHLPQIQLAVLMRHLN